MREIFHNPVMYVVRQTELGTGNGRTAVHGCNQPGNFIDMLRGKFMTCSHAAQQCLLGKLAHPDSILNRASFPVQRGTFRTAPYGDDIKVEIRGKPPVQPYFFLAVEPAFFQCREIEKTKIDGFLDLVDDPAGQNYPGDMGLQQLDVIDGMVIKRGVLQGVYQGHLVLQHGITPGYIHPHRASTGPPRAPGVPLDALHIQCLYHRLVTAINTRCTRVETVPLTPIQKYNNSLVVSLLTHLCRFNEEVVMKAGELCNREVITATRETTIPEAARLMRDHHVGSLVIVETTTA